MLSPTLIRLYEQTHYCFNSTILRIMQPSIEAKTLLESSSPKGGVFITAWNPLGKKVTDVENINSNVELKEELVKQGLNIIDGYGESPDGQWREYSFFAYPVSKNTSLLLCRNFRQNAVVYISSEGLPELLLNPDFV